MSHPSPAYMIFIVPVWSHGLGLDAHPPGKFGVGRWPVGHLSVPQLSQHTLLFIPGATMGQNNHDVLPGERDCQPRTDKFIPELVRVL